MSSSNSCYMNVTIRYALQLSAIASRGQNPAYQRPPRNIPELVASIAYQNSRSFREATEYVLQCAKLDPKVCQRKITHEDYLDMLHPEPHEDEVDETKDLEEEIYRLNFRSSFLPPAEQIGITYVWLLFTEQYGGDGFDNKTTYKECIECQSPLVIWRQCKSCLSSYITYQGIGIFSRCMDCRDEDHQRDLEYEDKCSWHGGPNPLRLRFD